MRRLLVSTLMLVLFGAAPASAGTTPWIATGTYYAGDILAYAVLDACGNPIQEGLDSNCVALDSNLARKSYTLRAEDDLGTIVDALVCFYSADRSHVECAPWDQKVPSWASYASVSSMGGLRVYWTLAVG